MGEMYCNLIRMLIVDDPEVYHHGPVAVQVVGRRLREEQILEIAESVTNALHKS
jgi:Asp-tRNA(Asn)/Glu-tRNA(Gln) amidotransferase A subunit family amidase